MLYSTRSGIIDRVGRADRRGHSAEHPGGRSLDREKLPAAGELAAGLGVNVHTALRAYSILRAAGVIELRQGRGARVLPRPEGLPKEVVDAIDALVRGAASRGVSRPQLVRYLEEMSSLATRRLLGTASRG